MDPAAASTTFGVRPAAQGDLEGIRGIAGAYGNLSGWPRRPDYLDHELSMGSLAVAIDGEDVLGFGGVLARDGVAHLADLFIRPDRLGRGIGRALLGLLLPAHGARVVFASRDPRALPLYASFGMTPVAPLLYLTGDGRAAGRVADPGVSLVEADAARLAEIDRVASGRDRAVDLEFLQVQAGAHGFAAVREGRAVGYAFCRLVRGAADSGDRAFIGPVGAATASDAVAALLAVLRWAGGQDAAPDLSVFGPSPALPVLLAAGFRIRDMDTFMSSAGGIVDLERYSPNPELG